MADNLVIFGHTYNGVEGFKATDTNNNEITYIPGGSAPVLKTLQLSYLPTESLISDTETPPQGYDGFDEVQVTVSAIPSSYVGSGVTRQAAQTIHPSTSDQSIATSQYLTGAQTIKGVLLTNLLAENIKSGVTVKVGDSTDDDCVTSVLGTYTGGVTAATGEITLASDFSLSATPAAFPLQLSFVPDFFFLAMTNASWAAKSAPSGGLYEIIMVKKAYTPPFRQSSSVSTDSFTLDHYTILAYNVTTTTDAATTNGYNLNGVTFVNNTYQQRFYFSNDGKLYVGRYSTASSKMFAGTYRYFAIKLP